MPPKKIEEQFHRLTLEPVQDVWHHQTCRWAIWYLCNCHPPTFVSSHAMKPYPFLLPEMIPAQHHLQATIGSSPTKYFLNNRISRTSERLKVLARSWLISKCPRTLDSNLAWTPHHSQQEDLRIQHPGNIHSFLWQVQKPWGPPEEARPGHYPCMGSIDYRQVTGCCSSQGHRWWGGLWHVARRHLLMQTHLVQRTLEPRDKLMASQYQMHKFNRTTESDLKTKISHHKVYKRLQDVGMQFFKQSVNWLMFWGRFSPPFSIFWPFQNLPSCCTKLLAIG